MKPVLVATAGCALLAGTVAWLVLRPGEGPQVAAPVETAEPPEESDTVAADGFELDPGTELESGESSLETRESFASDESPAPQAGGTAILAATSGTAPVRGLLADEATGEPLPFYLLRIEDGAGRREDVSTDERGRYVTGSPMAGGSLKIGFLDDPANRRTLPEVVRERTVVDGDAPDVDLSVASGPTFRFAIAPAGVGIVPTEFTARLHVRESDERGSDAGPPRELDPEPLRAGDPPWVRFGPHVGRSIGLGAEQHDERIELRSRDGLWIGFGKASVLRGIEPGLVEVRLEARAVLKGKLVDSDGKPIAGAQVRYQGVGAGGRSVDRRVESEEDGTYQIDLVYESRGTLGVRSFWHEPQDAEVALYSQRVTVQDFVLTRLPVAGAIRGRVESQTGAFEGGVRVTLRMAGGGRELAPQTARVDWSTEKGRRTGRFAFEGLPAGEYEVRLRNPGWFRFEPESAVVAPPSDATRFMVLDDLAVADLAFRVRDAENGATIDGYRAWVEPTGRRSFTKRLRSEDSVLTGYPLERKLSWRLDLPGYRPAVGDQTAFAVEEQRDGKVCRLAEIDLVPGWGELYRLVRRGTNRTISGVKIVLDGQEAGTTGADGTCMVTSRVRPGSIQFVYRDWSASRPQRQGSWMQVGLSPPPPTK